MQLFQRAIIFLNEFFFIFDSSAGIYTRGCTDEALAKRNELGPNFENLRGKIFDQAKTYKTFDEIVIVKDHEFSSKTFGDEDPQQIPGICFEVIMKHLFRKLVNLLLF